MPVRTIPDGRSDSTALADPASPDHANRARPCHPGSPETATVPTDGDPLSIKRSGDCRLGTGRLASHPVLGRAVAWRRNVMASLSSEAAGARQARLIGELIASRAWPTGPGPAAARWAVASAGLSPVATIGGWLVAEALQPPSYSPLRSTISGLAGLGATDRWIMTIALLMVGASYFATAACLPAVWVPARIVLMVAGLSSIGIALSPEPARGSTPQHLAWTSLGAVAITVWPAFTARQGPSPPPILQARGAAAVTAVFLALLAWLIFETQGGSALGLAERLVSAVEETWPLVVTLALRYAAEPADFTAHVTPDDSSAVQKIAKGAPEEVVGVGALRGDERGRNRT